jgi:hypothetical protein
MKTDTTAKLVARLGTDPKSRRAAGGAVGAAQNVFFHPDQPDPRSNPALASTKRCVLCRARSILAISHRCDFRPCIRIEPPQWLGPGLRSRELRNSKIYTAVNA